MHWTKDSHVQLKMHRENQVPVPQRRQIPLASYLEEEPVDHGVGVLEPSGLPASPAPVIPVGSVKVADGQIAYKTAEVVHRPDGDQVRTLTVGGWTVLRLSGSVEACTEDQIQDWPTVHYGDGSAWLPEAIIYSEVLDRKTINRMIRTLRKARDDAYEPDA